MTRAAILALVFGAWAALGLHFGFMAAETPLQVVALVAGAVFAAVAVSEVIR